MKNLGRKAVVAFLLVSCATAIVLTARDNDTSAPVADKNGVVNVMPGGSFALNVDWGGKRPVTFYQVSPGHALVPSGLIGEPDYDLVERIMAEFARVYNVRVRQYHSVNEPAGWSVDIVYDTAGG